MDIRHTIDRLYRDEGGRILAYLISAVDDFHLAEDVFHDAMIKALDAWQHQGIPDSPRAWIVTTARNRAIDRLRRQNRLTRKSAMLESLIRLEADVVSSQEDSAFPDERLRLIFTCCHPALSIEARVALTLRTICGLTTAQIAHAFLIPEATMAQRLVRAKRKIRDAGIPYAIPDSEHLEDRLSSVLAVLYLVFNEGYKASTGSGITDAKLCDEAIRLADILNGLMPDVPEVMGLLALMLLHDSRRYARIDGGGQLITLEDQDRSRWDSDKIQKGLACIESALRLGRIGPYQLQAAIAAVHAESARSEETDWSQIVALYTLLERTTPSDVVRLNRAVAVAMAYGPEAGLKLIDDLETSQVLKAYPQLPAAKADLLRRLDRKDEAVAAYEQALQLSDNDIERGYYERRIRALGY